MNIGFIGAGKVGFSLGKYFTEHGFFVCGYYSQHGESAREAARFTRSKAYDTVGELLSDSSLIFLTVPDGAIQEVYKTLTHFPLEGKMICHCSGALSGAVFEDIHAHNAWGASIHPFFAVSNKYESFKELSQAFFTLEGDAACIQQVAQILTICGNHYQVIGAEEKVRYHAAGAIASNLMTGLLSMAQKELMLCGFSEEMAGEALRPIVRSNMEQVLKRGAVAALTGPVERCDTGTVAKHLAVLDGAEHTIYQELSKYLIPIAEKKNPDRDYSKLKEMLDYEEHSDDITQAETGRQ